ncbi:hypothetical protein [Cerasicoccus maritimus]|uniref:RCC1 domain-containing protein n=1 Tax=Cerasicoccus maritimus TaxID=490089 RepID=UPI002852BC51|nr:hypothetical protein [Cerasicoccus maritimus]
MNSETLFSHQHKIPKIAAAVTCSMLVTSVLYGADILSAGDQFGGSIDSGVLRTWGLNDSGQLGQGTQTTNPTPESVDSNENFKLVEAGPDFMFGITEDGDVYAWGANSLGQLGIGSTDNESSPTSTTFSVKISDVSAGIDHALGIDVNGYLYAWGSVASGQLGLGVFQDPVPESFDDTIVESPTQVGTNTWLDIAAGSQFSVAVRSDNTLWIWGGGAISILGLSSSDYLSPVQVPGSTAISWAEVEAGSYHVIARTTDGRIYTWGINATGQLGLGDTTARTSPTQVGSATDWVSISTGANQSYAINSSGALYGWGLNSSEQLGKDVTVSSGSIPNNYMLTSPVVLASGVFSVVDGGRDESGSGGTMPDGTELTGFTLMKGSPNAESEGVYSVGGNLSGQLGTGSTSYSTSYDPQRTSADGAEISISDPTIATTTLGVNSEIQISVDVSNTGTVDVTDTYTVELYVSTSSTYSENTATYLAGRDIEQDLDVNNSKQETFNVEVPVRTSGTYYLISRVFFENSSSENSSDTMVGSTEITIVRPDIKIENLDFADGTTIDFGETFENISFEMTNGTIGIVNPETDITIEAYLITDLAFEAGVDTLPTTNQLIPEADTSYTGGLNAYDAGEDADPPVTVTISLNSLDLPETQSSREYFQIVFVVNRESGVGEEDGVTENNYLTQTVRIKSPDSVAAAIGFGDIEGNGADIGKVGQWASVTDQYAYNLDALQSPTLAPGGSQSMSLEVYGPTTISAPWLMNAGSDSTLTYTLKGADNTNIAFVGSAPLLDSLQPSYQAVDIVIDQDSALYSNAVGVPYPWTITWTYTQGAASETGYARVDLEVPNFVPDSNSFVFLGIDDESAPSGDDRSVSIDLDEGDFVAGQSAAMNLDYEFAGSSLVTFWWRTDGDEDEDTFTFSVDGEVQTLPTQIYGATSSNATISGYTGWQKVAFIVGGGPHTLRWVFSKGSDNSDANAYIDGLEVLYPLPEQNEYNLSSPNPDLVANVTAGDWNLITDTSAPNQQAYEVNGVAQGVSKTFVYDLANLNDLIVDLNGPTVIYAPWLISSTTEASDADADTLSYTLKDANDNQIIGADGNPFVVTLNGGVTSYKDVNIVIDEDSPLYDGGSYTYPWKIEWTYTQNSADAAAYARLAPTPYSFENIPVTNVDMAIQSVVLTEGTYILDDANGTGRLPISVSIINRGADFDVGSPESLTDDFLDPTNLSVHLSTDQIFGNSDDVNLGNFAQSNILNNGNQIIFQSEINLPFTTPAGNYYVLLRFDSSETLGEFTLANNSYTQGPGFVIVRAPNLTIQNIVGFSPTYPYHPEQSSYITYDIVNTGLGSVTEDEAFSVTVGLYARDLDSDEYTTATLIREYDAVEHSLFLPEVSAQYPNGSSSSIVHQLELPSTRDVLAGIGAVSADDPEDSAEVYNALYDMDDYYFYFVITVDVNDDILESSETNLFFDFQDFVITPVNYRAYNSNSETFDITFENFGLYTSHAVFSNYVITSDGSEVMTNVANALIPGYNGITVLLAYALGLNPTPGVDDFGNEYAQGSPLYRPQYANGVFSYDIEPYGEDDFLAMTFDFNVRASDIAIEVQASSDLITWDTILELTPPYTDISGEQSLTGFNGLIYQPVVMALEGNVSDVQDVYTARITVRDSEPYDGNNSRFMRIHVDTGTVTTPVTQPVLTSTLYYEDGNFESIILNWTGDPVYETGSDTLNGAYHIERAVGEDDFELLAVVITALTNGNFRYVDESASAGNTYTYRVRAVSIDGAGTYSDGSEISVPTQ